MRDDVIVSTDTYEKPNFIAGEDYKPYQRLDRLTVVYTVIRN